ncbi:MAG TPA: flagellar filament capping protein FliD [Nocardioidaceae bacterium]|nr:flagellar filament capping protein FliD [Nocardioidaceae bacterium]
MVNTSVSGLISGLDTASLINQLMQVEAQGQTRLKIQMSAAESTVSALQSLNSKLTTVATKALELATDAGWSPLVASSSSEHVTAVTTSDDAPSSLSFSVKQTARAHQLSFTTSAALDAQVTAAGSTVVRLDSLDGTVTEIETGDGTLGGLVDALNASDAGVRASTLRLDDGSYRLRVQSEVTGEATDFTLTNADGTDLLGGAAVTTGRDAAITIGSDTVHSSTNTFSGVVTGLDVILASETPAGTAVAITVGRDAEAMTEQVEAMVEAANAALADISRLTAYDSTTERAGQLVGDTTLRSLSSDLISSVTSGVDGKSLAAVGIEIDRSGRVTFDAEKFAAAYAADPAGVSAQFTGTATWSGTGEVTMVGAAWRTAPGPHTVEATTTGGTIDGRPATVSGTVLTGADGTGAAGLAITVTGTASGTLTYTQGFAARLAAVAERASDSTVGTVTSAINGRTSMVDSLEDAIAGWDVRLDLRRQALTRQYAALEVALGQLQNQSQWLAGQIGSLPTYSS